MIIASIDLQDGQAVQLVGGEKKALDAGDPRPIADRFGRVSEVAVIDLDAAMGTGNNAALIQELLGRARCRVGGGIRDVDTALHWLDQGASKVILGTAAKPEILSKLPRERVIAALDARHGEVVVEGWKKGTGRTITERMAELRDHVGGFLVTFVEREGRLEGLDLEHVRALVEAAKPARLTVAGGVTTAEDVAAIDAMGADAQVGMALYTGRFDLGDAIAATLKSDRPDGLWPTVVVDAQGVALGLTYSDRESLKAALVEGRGIYHSRTRGLWRKGETSGALQTLLRVDIDCDRDALRFTVEQAVPGFCHFERWTCWDEGAGLGSLERRLRARVSEAPEGSYTARLLNDSELLRLKLVEEAQELAAAETPADVAHEAADVIYFAMVAMARAGVTVADVERVLDARSLKVHRRPGNAKVQGKG
jgi:phosphoribosyl-ATP pyrophosphohydrolase